MNIPFGIPGMQITFSWKAPTKFYEIKNFLLYICPHTSSNGLTIVVKINSYHSRNTRVPRPVGKSLPNSVAVQVKSFDRVKNNDGGI